MEYAAPAQLAAIFEQIGCRVRLDVPAGLAVTSPADGAALARLEPDTPERLDRKLERARSAQNLWQARPRGERVALAQALAEAIRARREALAEIIVLEGGKSRKEALAEADGSADILLKTVKNITLPELNGMLRCKERLPAGVVALITSFNFPLAVANWTLAPALLAANAVVWKPSEKTPLTALAYKAIFDASAGASADLLQVTVGGRDIGAALAAHEGVDMVSATGSVGMGKGIKEALARKKNPGLKPILELGGNNAVILSSRLSPAHLEWSLSALMHSFLGTTGQRCTNTRRLIAHRDIFEPAVAILRGKITSFTWEDYGYGALIDADAYRRFERAKTQAVAEGGTLLFGNRLREAQYPDAYYVEPALALMPAHGAVMHEEVFAPLLFIVPYEGGVEAAIALANLPANAGLVNGIYTQSQREADLFARDNQAGHGLINSPRGTGTPAYDMGFGGNKDSGEGEILNAADPLRPFTRDTHYSRIAWNKDVAMEE